MKPLHKGYLLAAISVLAFSSIFIISKILLSKIHIIQFGFYWYGFALLWLLLFMLKVFRWSWLKELGKTGWIALIVSGMLEVLTAGFFFLSIREFENPALVAFLGNMGPALITLLSVLLLHDRLNRIEVAGVALALTGALIISYNGSIEWSSLFIPGSMYVVLAYVFDALSTIVAKKYIGRVHPYLFSLNRSIYLFLISFVLLFASGISFSIPAEALKYAIIGSLLGPFVTSVVFFYALRYMEAWRYAMLMTTRSILVLFISWFVLSVFPLVYQLIGGLVTITGVILITTGHRQLERLSAIIPKRNLWKNK